jgi:ferredoxin
MHTSDKIIPNENSSGVTALGQQTRNGTARITALSDLQQQVPATTSVIEYRSQGRLVIIGPATQAIPIAQQLLDALTAIAIVDTEATAPQAALDDRIVYVRAEVDRIEGHLGDFQVHLRDRGKQPLSLLSVLNRSWTQIDLVLDLLPTPIFDAQISPPGYFATRGNADRLAVFSHSIPEMVGEFEKPRYFHYDPSICAHARNHKTACTRCIDACPTLAIHSIGEQIQVDPYLCQGGGSCAAVCPSGAIQYVYPPLADLLGQVRQVLKRYRQAQGEDARIVFFKEEDSAAVYSQLTALEENLLPLALDELGALDLAIMLNTLAYGAQQVIVVIASEMPSRLLDSLHQQHDLANRFLTGLGYSNRRIVLAMHDMLSDLPRVSDPPLPPASYGSFSEKRTMIRLALEHLALHAPQPVVSLPLSAHAPFGEISVDPQACTLCLACTGVCPTRALLAGNETPQLNFIEDHCVQCGLCEQTCPENAIRRHPRYLFDEERRRSRRELHAEAPFRCISCGKAFATQRMIEHMQEKLMGHWMFGNDRALRRLKMCEDCRIKDIWDEQGR